MIPELIVLAISEFTDEELQIFGETLCVSLKSQPYYAFSEKNKMFSDTWSRSDFLRYFNEIDFNSVESEFINTFVTAVISTILTIRKFKDYE